MSRRARLLAALVVVGLLAGCARASGTNPAAARSPAARPSAASPSASTARMPALRHVYVIIMENEDYSAVVGSSAAPYVNSLIAQYGLATNYVAVAHPSQPNYVALFSGSTQGIHDDNHHDISATNLADQLESHGRTWRVYAQNYPGGCFNGDVATGGPDGSGTYARKHNAAISFTDISGNPARCANIGPLAGFDPAAADFELVIPNLCNDMHDCGVSAGDSFLQGFVPKITGSTAFADSALFVVWDEGKDDSGPGGHVPAIVVSPLVRAGATVTARYDHYALLRSIEDGLGLGCLAQACSSGTLADLFAR